MASLFSPIRVRTFRPGPAQLLAAVLGFALLALVLAIGPYRLLAQIEGDRGIAPLATTSDIQSGPVDVETTGKTAEEARLAGWKLAQSKAWEALKGPKMSDDQIDGMVSAVVIEHEQIGPRRYIATLSIIFDRTKAGPLLGVDTQGGEAKARSAPLLVIPVLYSGGASQVFEVRGPWQKAWANFNTGSSAVDYVRPSGEGGQSLILTAGQPSRRSRLWWRTVLDQFDAADVIMPVARLERQWPGGPVRGTFTARYGPDNTYLDSFTLSANDEKGLPAMLRSGRGEARPHIQRCAQPRRAQARSHARRRAARARFGHGGTACGNPARRRRNRHTRRNRDAWCHAGAAAVGSGRHQLRNHDPVCVTRRAFGRFRVGRGAGGLRSAGGLDQQHCYWRHFGDARQLRRRHRRPGGSAPRARLAGFGRQQCAEHQALGKANEFRLPCRSQPGRALRRPAWWSVRPMPR